MHGHNAISIDNILPEKSFKELLQSVPSEGWYNYDNPIEKKRACNTFEGPLKALVYNWHSLDFLKLLKQYYNLKHLTPDINLYGGGIHSVRRGGKLNIHLDHNVNPRTEGYRRLNLIYWFHQVEWKEEWGGHLEIWEDGKCVERFLPKANRMVIFDCSDTYHGHPHPLQCPEDVERLSLALYYFSKDEKPKKIRQRAKFLGVSDERLLKLREISTLPNN